MKDDRVMRFGPPVLRNRSFQLLFRLEHIAGIRQTDAVADAEHMRVDRDPLMAERLRHHNVGGLLPDPGQRLQFFLIVRHLAVILLDQRPGLFDDPLRLGLVQPDRADDLRHIGGVRLRHRKDIRICLEQDRCHFVHADIRDAGAVARVLAEHDPDYVVNFAAESHVDRSIEDPGIFLETNIMGTAVLMDACRKYGIERFHQVSTDEVYGDLPLDRPDLFFTEETPIHTSSPYSTSKASADLLVLAYHRTYGLPVTISRCSNNYGPYQFPEKLIPLMIANALHDQPLPVYGEGLNVRDWLYVEDHCKAIDLILRGGRVGEVYNIGGHNEMRNIDIVKLICAELGKPESLITYVTDRKGHDQRYAIDPAKIHGELGWLPETMFKDGIKKTIHWYLDHQEWWETIRSGEYMNYYEKMYGNR